MRTYSLTSFLLFIVFLITAHTFNYDEAALVGYADVEPYHYISTHGINNDAGSIYPYRYLERWPLHLIVKWGSETFNLNVWIIYRYTIIILGLLCFVVIKKLNISDLKKIAIFTFIIFNPYSFRLYYAVPGMVSDCALLVSFLIVICGILLKSHTQIILGILLAIIARQNSILLIPILVILYYSKYLSKKNLVIYCLIILFGVLSIKLLTTKFYGGYNSNYLFNYFSGIILWIFNNFSISSAISFFGRYIFFLLTLSGFIYLIDKDHKHIWVFIIIFLFTHLQPLMGGPLITSGNIQRLSALGLPFLSPLIINSSLNNKSIICFIVISVMTSFHHHSSIFYYIDNGRILFLSLVLVLFPLIVFCRRFGFKTDNNK